MIIRRIRGAGGWIRQHHKRVLLFGIGGILILLTVIQLRYPANALLPFASIDGVSLGGWDKAAAIAELDSKYRFTPVAIYFGSDVAAYRSPKPADIGITASSEQSVKSLDYPWYMNLAPGWLLWGHLVMQPKPPAYSYDKAILSKYIKKELGESCSVQPQNANLRIEDNKVQVVNGFPGGTCSLDEVTKILGSTQLNLQTEVKVDIPVKVIPAEVDDNTAQVLANEIEAKIKEGINITVGSDKILVSRDMLISWLDFAVTEGHLDYSFSTERASKYLTDQLAVKVASPPGVTTINTYNFLETSRQTGVSGQTLDVTGTLARLKSFVAGETEGVTPATSPIAPSIRYTRAYSNDYQGLAAVMQNFASTHSGVYGVVLTELSGQYRRATYNSGASFTTASTYKLFVAYSTLLRIESGAWHWSDQINGGRDLTRCFDDMIVLSDNNCAHALLDKIGFTAITNEARSIGCSGTSFLGSNGIKTSTSDLALLLAELQTGQILSEQSSRDTLINAMKRNVYRKGIPSGVDATVADKVGFLDGLLHDAAIVYPTTGPYVLVIMTDGSSWANIAQLTREIEALRIQ